MKRLLVAAILAVGAPALLSACAEDTPEIFIVANQVFSDDCEPPLPGSSASVYRNRGVLDLFVTDSYVMIPRVESTLVGSDEVSFGAAGGEGLNGASWEANHILLRRAVVRFDAPDALGVPLPRELEIELSGAISPGQSATIEMQAITPSLGTTLANSRLLREARTSLTIDLRVKFFGVTSAGREVDSNEFIYPVELCYGCLMNFPPEAIDEEHAVQPNCRNIDELAEDASETLCLTGQDEPVDCRIVCPIVTSTVNGDPEGICEPSVGF